MKSRKTRFTALAVVALASVFFLGACGGQKQATTSSSSSKTSQVTKSTKMTKSSSKAKTEKKAKSEETKPEATQDKTSASAKQETSSAKVVEEEKSPNPTNQTPAPKQDSEATQASAETNKDYSLVAGTWQNDEGQTITINPDGTVSGGSKLEDGEQRDGYYHAGIRFPEGAGAAVFYATAGQEFPEAIASKQFTDETDINRERLVVGQSEDAMAHPFYRTE
ncbi:hypothetical protein STRDD10_00685 [Streptococcus sp. DD10]|uniref:DUF6287 domain-containing protein n=1 Tax=Streptococcus sp. DD10 TaxID=1777878 RepID=UPI0007963341|nr:DUF6287 domain-containing protein [Streptococcus sp. DD10]KXT74739.1 hypothetical protein STRDD10_00685 [Streptococcus sp. DD10]